MRRKARLEVLCPQTQQMTAPPRHTHATATWDRGDFSINSTHPIRGIYQAAPIYGASASVEHPFSEGRHHIEYRVVDETGRHASCSFSVIVNVIRCPGLSPPELGRLSCDARDLLGSQCAVSCVQGYQLTGQSALECRAPGEWTTPMPYCRAQQCTDPGAPLHGFRSCTSTLHSYGSVCSFGCKQGYRLVGSLRLVCELDTRSVTRWSAEVPICTVTTPPVVATCPSEIRFTASNYSVVLDAPEVRFLTSEGHPAPHVCSPFGPRRAHVFSLGRHTVTCETFDENYRGYQMAVCQFDIIVQSTPCSPLPLPQNGHLTCSPGVGRMCSLHCSEGHVFPLGHVRDFYCEPSGHWSPYFFVPSCVVPLRPAQLELPAEMVFTSTNNCSSIALLGEIATAFRRRIETMILERGASVRPHDVECRLHHQHTPRYGNERLPAPSSESRVRRYVILASANRTDPQWALDARILEQLQLPRRHERRAKTHTGDQTDQPMESSFIIAIKFYLTSTVHNGKWPDELHKAQMRLTAMFGQLEQLILEGQFALQDYDGVHEVRNGLTHAHTYLTKCEEYYKFNETLQLCVPCGAGTFYNLELEDCELCGVGKYQADMGTEACIECPLGTTTMHEGSNGLDKCKEIDECASNPCQHGGLCEEQRAAFRCHCEPGFTGSQCESRVYDCSEHACQQGGTCVPLNETEYTCQCRTGYHGDYCQFQAVDGGWSEWGEWSTCSQSCQGGVQQRMRHCDSPVPTAAGLPCAGTGVQNAMCNLHECPECERLRRPYGGWLHCQQDDTQNLTTCTITCQQGYTFSVPVLDVYTCGPSTSFLWPHESPDNPSAAFPTCTKLVAPVAESYTLEASVQAPCDAEARKKFVTQLAQVAHTYTQTLSCIRDGSCRIEEPQLSSCKDETIATTTGSESSLISMDTQSRVRKRKSIRVETVQARVSLTYDFHNKLEDSRLSSGDVDSEILALADRLLRTPKNGLHVALEDHEFSVRLDNARVLVQPLCPPGTIPSEQQNVCVECGAGTWYSEQHALCLPCEEGTYQPLSRQLQCLSCPKDHTAHGRGAILLQECYSKVTPSHIPKDFPVSVLPDGCEGCGVDSTSVLVLSLCVPLLSLIFFVVLILVICKRRRSRKSQRYRVDRNYKDKDPATTTVLLTRIDTHNSQQEQTSPADV